VKIKKIPPNGGKVYYWPRFFFFSSRSFITVIRVCSVSSFEFCTAVFISNKSLSRSHPDNNPDRSNCLKCPFFVSSGFSSVEYGKAVYANISTEHPRSLRCPRRLRIRSGRPVCSNKLAFLCAIIISILSWGVFFGVDSSDGEWGGRDDIQIK
jgi:hypothetical protein